MKKLIALVTLLAVISFSGVATAALVTPEEVKTWNYSSTLSSGPVTDNKSGTISVQKFDPTLGTLQSISISMSVSLDQDLQFTKANTNANADYSYSTTAAIGISNATWSVNAANGNISSNAGTLKVQDFDTALGSGKTKTTPLNFSNVILLDATNTNIPSSLFSSFTGDGKYDFYTIAYLTGNLTGFDTRTATTTGLATVKISYTYNPVPIPAAFWMLGTGLIGLVAIRRRRK